MIEAYAKPLPMPSPESAPFWEGVRRHEFRLQHCQACQRCWFPPSGVCPECLGDAWEWLPTSGRGTVYSWVVMHRVYHKGFTDDVPYVVALIQLEEGPRFLSNLVDCGPDDVALNLPVEVVYDDITPEHTLPKFRRRAS